MITSIHRDGDPRVGRHLDSLRARGMDVTFISPWPGELVGEGIDHLPFPRRTGPIGLARVHADIRARLGRTTADVFHFHDLDLVVTMSLFHLRTGRPVVYDIHENYPVEMLEKPYLPRWLGPPLERAVWLTERWATGAMRNFVYVVDSIRRGYDRPGVRCAQVRNFVHPPRAPYAPYRERDAVVSFVASQYPTNGAELLLDIAERVGRTHPHVRFEATDLFHHAEGYRRKLMDRASRPPLAGRVSYLPKVPAGEVWRYIDAARVGLYLGLDVPSQRRALPTKFFEYMARGTPMVASDLPYSRQYVAGHHAGLLARPGDADDFARQIRALLDDPAGAERMGLNGRSAVESELNWAHEMDTLEAFYRRIARR